MPPIRKLRELRPAPMREIVTNLRPPLAPLTPALASTPLSMTAPIIAFVARFAAGLTFPPTLDNDTMIALL